MRVTDGGVHNDCILLQENENLQETPIRRRHRGVSIRGGCWGWVDSQAHSLGWEALPGLYPGISLWVQTVAGPCSTAAAGSPPPRKCTAYNRQQLVPHRTLHRALRPAQEMSDLSCLGYYLGPQGIIATLEFDLESKYKRMNPNNSVAAILSSKLYLLKSSNKCTSSCLW